MKAAKSSIFSPKLVNMSLPLKWTSIIVKIDALVIEYQLDESDLDLNPPFASTNLGWPAYKGSMVSSWCLIGHELTCHELVFHRA